MLSLHHLVVGFVLFVLCFRTAQVLADVTAYVVALRTRMRSFECSFQQYLLRSRWSHLVIVGHKLPLMCTAICSAFAPVEAHVVKHVVMTVVRTRSIQSSAHAPVASLVVSQQVMMEAGTLSAILTTANCCSITMLRSGWIVRMTGNIERLTDERSLECYVLRSTTWKALINSPRNRAMVHDGMVVASHSEPVESVVGICVIGNMSTSHTNKASNSVVGHSKGCTSKHDATFRSRLTSNCHKWVITRQSALQMNHTRHIEHNSTWTFSLRNSIAERSWLRVLRIVIERGHMIDRSTTSAYGKATITFSTRKRHTTRLETPHHAFVGLAVNHFINTPEIALQGRQATLVHRRFIGDSSACSISNSKWIVAEITNMTRGTISRRPAQRDSIVSISMAVGVNRVGVLRQLIGSRLWVELQRIDIETRGCITDWGVGLGIESDDNCLFWRLHIKAERRVGGSRSFLSPTSLLDASNNLFAIDSHVDRWQHHRSLVIINVVVVGLKRVMTSR